jgi:Nif-specific regulatory protein
VTRVLEHGELTIGRDETSTLPISDPALSRRHCVFTVRADGLAIKDVESLNGTFVNGIPVREQTLAVGDRIRIGDSICIVVGTSDGSPALQPVADDDFVLPPASTICIPRDGDRYLHPGPIDAQPVDRSVRDLRTLLDISTAVHTVRRRDRLEHRLVDLTMRAIPADCGLLIVGDNADHPLVPAVQRGIVDASGVSQKVIRRVLRDGAAIMSNDAGVNAPLGTKGSVIDAGIRSVLCAPLTAFDRTVGVLYLASRGSAAFDADDLHLLMGIAGLAAVALENARQTEELERDTVGGSPDGVLNHGMVGDSSAMREVSQTIAKLAARSATVLIRGESGTGKELAARAIHANSPRAERPFVPINCGALTETLLESELFGHERGSFTGAIAQKRGKVELADGGTLFLDEVGELTPAMQVKLLRVLQEREFERVGGTRRIKVDIRLIAATNRDLEAAIKAGTFRSDLYYRLNVVPFTMPPLRNRTEDIQLLANYFIEKYSARCNRRVRGMSAEARALLIRYLWPGNVRELENAIERAIVMGSTDYILQEDLPDSLLETNIAANHVPQYHGALNDTKRRLIVAALERAGGNYTEAAKILEVHPNYLHRLVKNLELRDQIPLRRPSSPPSRPRAV